MMCRLGIARGIADERDRIIATAMTLTYEGRIGWIGMVLVAGAWRKRGIATRLLHSRIGELQTAGVVPGLDATPAGERVYVNLGFKGTFGINRMRRQSAAFAGNRPDGVRPISLQDFPAIADLDAATFGVRRESLLRSLCEREPLGGWICENGGFLMHRSGRNGRQLGPLCAPDEDSAACLLAAAMLDCPEALVIDVPQEHTGLLDSLRAAGFERERPFLRMYLGVPPEACDTSRLFAIAGPELG